MSEQISLHITLQEAIKSNTASRLKINNTPTDKDFRRMSMVAHKLFEPIRKFQSDRRGKSTPINISSFFRNQELNQAVGGSNKSQHITGEAMDIKTFKTSWFSNYELGLTILHLNLIFDQIIFEFPNPNTKDIGWIHISYDFDNNNRNQILFATKKNNRTTYLGCEKKDVFELLENYLKTKISPEIKNIYKNVK